MNYYSFCSFLPGATTTQLICLLAYRKGGLKLVFPTMFIWISPAFTIATFLAMILLNNDIISSTNRLFFFFKPMVVSFMIYASMKAKSFYFKSSKDLILIFLNVLLLIIFFKHPFIIPMLFIINALYAHYRYYAFYPISLINLFRRFTINYHILILYITIFISFGFLSEYSRKYETKNRYFYNLIEHNFRFGSVVYGGGDVLIPLMYEQYISRPSARITQKRNPDALSLNKDELITAAGVIRLIPGPVFVLTAFTAPYLLKDFDVDQKILGSILSTISLFLPGILILLILAPFWYTLYHNKTFSNIVSGINLTVFSIMIASSIYMSADLLFIYSLTGYESIFNLVMIIALLLIMFFSKLNHTSIAFICLSLGLIYHFL